MIFKKLLQVLKSIIQFLSHTKPEPGQTPGGGQDQPGPPAPSGKPDIVVCSFNIKRGTYKGTQAIADFLQSEGVELCGLQEVLGAPDPTLERIKTSILQHSKFIKTLELGDGREYGIGLLCQYDMTPQSETTLPNYGERRKLQRTTITLNGTEVAVYNTHLDWSPGAPAKQNAAIKAILDTEKLPFILFGDFNSQDFSIYQEYTVIFDGIIDNIIVRGLAVESSKIVRNLGLSDHDPIIAVLKVPSDGRG